MDIPSKAGMSTARLLETYRRTGADLPWGQPERAHGVGMEGYFWRFTGGGRTVIVLIGVNQGPKGAWATVGVASSADDTHRGGLVTAALDGAWADSGGLGAGSGNAFIGTDRQVVVRMPGVDVDVRLDNLVRWPRRPFGGSSWFQTVPGLNQYWHPWLLGGSASGRVVVEGDAIEFRDAQLYGEKNWGRGGFPDAWWWGQAQGFGATGACVAFAGGQVSAGPIHTEVTGLVVRLPDGRVLRLGNPGTSPVQAQVSDSSWVLRGRSRRWQVEIEASAHPRDAHVLPVPLPAEHRNTPGALEHLTGDLRIVVRERGREVWRGHSALAGLEHGGLAKAEAELLHRGGDPRPVTRLT
ncbi:tocopherol cyclase family protein [Janibacter sp. G56]|uniref:tocopherol cyclase family protein n=1 Tax=Janibacter sp. G56 TaxID=3418717 RepID=UPI003D034C07